MLQKMTDEIMTIKLEFKNEIKTNNAVNIKNSYADAVKTTIKPAVNIKPRNDDQNSSKTINDFKSGINHKEIDVCGIRNIKSCGIVISCDTVNETIKAKRIIGALA